MKKIKQYLNYFYQSIKNRGFLFTFQLLWNEWRWEKKLGVSTLEIENLEKLNLAGLKNSSAFHHYQGASYFILNEIFKKIPIEYKNQRFIDLGCGKGRVLIMAHLNGMEKLTGVDIAKELLQKTNSNIELLKRKKITIKAELIQADAGLFIFPPDTGILFLFNPFGEEVMKKVIDNLSRFEMENHKKIMIIYVNPTLEKLWEDSGFEKVYELRSKNYSEAIILQKK